MTVLGKTISGVFFPNLFHISARRAFLDMPFDTFDCPTCCSIRATSYAICCGPQPVSSRPWNLLRDPTEWLSGISTFTSFAGAAGVSDVSDWPLNSPYPTLDGERRPLRVLRFGVTKPRAGIVGGLARMIRSFGNITTGCAFSSQNLKQWT